MQLFLIDLSEIKGLLKSRLVQRKDKMKVQCKQSILSLNIDRSEKNISISNHF